MADSEIEPFSLRGSNLASFPPGERQAFEKFWRILNRQRGAEITECDALSEWFAHYAEPWRARRHTLALARQRDEIQKHKWLESEKASRDIGKQAAMDWITKYAAQWRDWFEGQADSEDQFLLEQLLGESKR